ncbi:MAG: PAS domain-containing protein [Actinomycetota bacterium]
MAGLSGVWARLRAAMIATTRVSDDDQFDRAIVRSVLVTLVFTTGSASVVLLATGTNDRAIAPAGLATTSLLALGSLRRLGARPVAWIVTATFLFVPLVVQATQSGVRDPAGFVSLVAIAFAAVMLGRRAAVVAIAVSVLGAVTLYVLERFDVIEPEPADATVSLIARTAILIALGAMLIAYLLQGERVAALRSVAERERDATTAFYERVLGASSLMVSVIDGTTGRRIWASPALVDLLGVTPEQFNTMADEERWALIHPDDRAAEQQRIADVQAGRIDDVGGVHRLRTTAGWRWCRVQFTRLDAGEGPPLRVESVTDEHERTESDRRRLSMLDASPIPAAVRTIDADELVYVNPAWTRLTGLDAAGYNAVHGDDGFALIHPDDHQIVRDAVRGPERGPAVARFRTIGGDYRWFQAAIRRHDSNGDGRPDQLLVFQTDITDVLEGQARADAMIGKSPVAHVIFDLDSNVIEYANDALTELSGRTMDEWNDLGPPDVRAERIGTPAEDRSAIFAAIDEAFSTGTATSVRRRWRHADGTTRWLDCRYQAFPDPLNPEARRVLMTAADITDEISAAAQHSALLESAPVLVTIGDVASGIRTYVSPEFTRVTGYTLDQYNALSREEQRALVHPDDRHEVLARAQAFAASNGTTGDQVMYRLQTVDGWRWVTTEARVLETESDGSLKTIMVSAVDVHDRVDAESFRESILDASPAGITVYDFLEDRIDYVNAAFIELTGHSRDDLAALPSAFTHLVPEPERTTMVSASILARRTGESRSVRHRIRQADGSYAWYESTLRRFPEDDPGQRTLVSSVEITAQMEAEARSQTILESSPNIIVVYDPDGRSTEYANPTFMRITGFDLDDLAAIDRAEAHQLLHPADDQREADAIDQAVAGGEPVSLTVRVRTAGGEYRWLQSLYQHLPDPTGAKPRRVLITGTDVTDLLAAEVLTRSIVEASPVSFTVYDQAKQRYEWTNPAFVHATGFDADELNAHTADGRPTMTLADDRAIEDHAIEQAVRTGESIEVRHRLRDADGRIRSFDSRYTSLRDVEGQPTERILVSSIDITDRLEAESREHAVLSSSPAMTIVVDIDRQTLIYANRSFLEFNGATDVKAPQVDMPVLGDNVPAEDLPLLGVAVATVVRDDTPQVVAHRFRRSDGTLRHFQSHVARFPDPLGLDKRLVVITSIDVTKRRAAEAALEAERARLERANRDLQEFVYIASHDLQEPLRTLSAFTDLLSLELPDDLSDDAQASLRFIRQGAGRMRSLVQGLLEYSRIGPGRHVRNIDMAALVTGLIDDLADQISREDAMIHVGTLPVVRGDGTELRLIVQNLVSNAIKFRHPDRTPEVTVDAAATADGWRFSVTDNGIGVADRHVERIFAIFQRLHAADTYEGSGMGLAYAKRAVANHGGEIGVESDPEVGSTFWFTLSSNGEA